MQTEAPVDRLPMQSQLLGAQFLEYVMKEVRQLPGWNDLNQAQQDLVIQRMRTSVQKVLNRALQILFVGDHPSCAAHLKGVSFTADGMKGNVTIAKDAAGRHQLVDNIGQSVLIIIGSAEAYCKRMEEIKARADQGDLFDSGSTLLFEADRKAAESEFAIEIDSEVLLVQLKAAGVNLTPAAIAGWSEAQCGQALAWAQSKAANPDTAYPCPEFVKDAPRANPDAE